MAEAEAQLGKKQLVRPTTLRPAADILRTDGDRVAPVQNKLRNAIFLAGAVLASCNSSGYEESGAVETDAVQVQPKSPKEPMKVPYLDDMQAGAVYDKDELVAFQSMNIRIENLQAHGSGPIRFTIHPEGQASFSVLSDSGASFFDFSHAFDEATTGFCVTAETVQLDENGAVAASTPLPFRDTKEKGSIYEIGNGGPDTCLLAPLDRNK